MRKFTVQDIQAIRETSDYLTRKRVRECDLEPTLNTLYRIHSINDAQWFAINEMSMLTDKEIAAKLHLVSGQTVRDVLDFYRVDYEIWKGYEE